MTNELYDKVVAYRISMSVIKSMLKSNIITAQEYSESLKARVDQKRRIPEASGA